MGTRHVTMVYQGGAYKVAQYGQWDGYPEGQGATVLEFLRTMDREQFLANLSKCRALSDEEVKALWVECGAPADGNGFVSMTIADIFKSRHPHLSRDTGAKILQAIHDAPDGLPLRLDLDFPGDSIFCEWAWVVDFDKDVFEAYRGFNETPLAEGDRFFHLGSRETKNWKGKTTTYHPVRLVRFWPLSDLPYEEEFLTAFLENDEDGDPVVTVES